MKMYLYNIVISSHKDKKIDIKMENLLRKSLNKREKCFEINACPEWLSTILPTRIKSVELIVENDNEQTKVPIDLSPYQLNSSIPKLNEEILNQTKINVEYPNDISQENQLLNNASQLIFSPSNEQLIYLFNKLKQFQPNEKKISSYKTFNQCQEENCSNKKIPLNDYCLIHLFENDSKQILFVKCNHCQHISIKDDNRNILHICS
jgi:hypothetical protein